MNIDAIISAIPTRTPAQRREMRANAERWQAKGTPAQQEAALRMIEALDAFDEAERQGQVERVVATPVPDRVAQAFKLDPPSEAEEKVLRALLDHPGSTSAALSRVCGWGGQAWHLHFGETARARESYLWPAEPSQTRDGNFYSGILADFDPDGSRFTMKAEVAEGLATVGLSPSSRAKDGKAQIRSFPSENASTTGVI